MSNMFRASHGVEPSFRRTISKRVVLRCLWQHKEPFSSQKTLPGNILPYCGKAALPDGMEDLPVASFVTNDSWNWDFLNAHLPIEILQYIASIKPPALDEGRDFPASKFSANGEFTIKSAYEFLKTINTLQGRLLTNSERAKRGMTQDDLCPRCNSEKETLIQALRDWVNVVDLWESLIDHNDWASFFSLGQERWLRKYLEFSGNAVAEVAWSFLFPVGIWLIWKDRNSLVFQQKTDIPGNLFFHIVSYARRIIEVVAAPSPIVQRIFRKEELIGWTKPSADFYKLLNVDGSILGINLQASCGGVIRDHDGEFVKATHSENLIDVRIIWLDWAMSINWVSYGIKILLLV
ncbi:ribonuclease H [Sesbania bispinosa]|nr:ribonuclease H [Sesbania bispinosa]